MRVKVVVSEKNHKNMSQVKEMLQLLYNHSVISTPVAILPGFHPWYEQ